MLTGVKQYLDTTPVTASAVLLCVLVSLPACLHGGFFSLQRVCVCLLVRRSVLINTGDEREG